ncbi:hypothetical protein SAMN04488598_10750 [Halanaerobium congolense]|uniref:Tetratricopeptide repeat protein n=2 Tax=Halanaerobium congolense TaxID=54121 RepID=A0A1H9ZTK1_9FIRM|nr:hypothetical protein [Halanaerobium congolense]PTX16375.1 hypothetical protein C7953_1091 [Halanaerobium congolense]SDF16889.1 hypothetical protein SAMN04488598_10750 [Halanaerobium congolense]SES84593.1 hypothetical protein SAMN04515652_10850 [Halanaerobium congolense]SFO95481.1 hypothetical protein SAMN04488596_10370 [Halanaerobium congolense]
MELIGAGVKTMAELASLLISFAELINNKFVLVNLVILVFNVLLLHNYIKLRHPRYIYRYLTFMAILLVIINYFLLGIINFYDVLINIILALLLITYIFVSYFSAKMPLFLSKIKLNKLKKTLNQGRTIENEDLFTQKPIYMVDFVEKYNYNLLKADYYQQINKLSEAYQVYNEIDDNKLFSKEKKKVRLNKANLLIKFGNLSKAERLLNIIDDQNDPFYLMLRSILIERKTLNLETVNNLLQKAVDIISDNDDFDNVKKAMIYNNYGRVRCLEGNKTDAINYYTSSVELAQKANKKHLIHVSYQNLVHTLILNREFEKSQEYMSEYQKLIDSDIILDSFELFNLKIELARQKMDKNQLITHLIDSHFDLRPKLSQDKKLALDINSLRLMFNSGMNGAVILREINKNINEYLTMKMPGRYNALKEISIVLKQLRIRGNSALQRKVIAYMKKDAISDLEDYILKLEQYEIKEKSYYLKEKIGLIRDYTEPYNFEKTYELLDDIKNIYQNNNMLAERLGVELDIADEALFNITEDSIKEKDKFFEVMKKYVELADNELVKLNSLSILELDTYYVRIAFYYLVIGNDKKAKFYLDKFESLEKSILNYALWIQKYYIELKKHFEKKIKRF